jgi:EAL domain-containing protein (putative c-di-GMP-specific phosphodiesterase class I)
MTEEPSTDAAPPRSRGKLLLVEDEDALLRITARLLTVEGYEVRTAKDGQSASALLAENAFDAVVSDIDMPRMSGIKLLQIIREQDLDVPVILMTGVPDVETAMQAIAHGAHLYLSKPVDAQELTFAVAKAVRLNQIAKLKREALVIVDRGGFGNADHVALEASFQRTLNTLWLAYQPIVSVGTRSLFGYEALLRSEEPSLPHPGAILDAAERLGRLHDLGQKIRALACDSMTDVAPSCAFFVNLHAHDLLDPMLRSPDAPLSLVAKRVVLEITERASLDGVKDVGATIAELRGLGFRIAIDDLGAGYAGLTSFATLQPEFVKLDMSLIRDVDKSAVKEKLVRSMTTLCRDLAMSVVAEGIETIEEREALVHAGVDLLQGYLLARPGKPFPGFSW